jgi:predicted dehydrogenase
LAGSFASLDDALSQRFEAAVVATPAPSHVPLATRLAEAGLHLLIEKPLSTGLDGVDRLLETVRDRGVTAAVAYVYRAHPALAAMRRAIAEGRFGQPLQLVVVAGQHFPKYRPAYRETYFADRGAGGGAIQDALTHVLNAGEWIVGPVTRVSFDAAHCALADVEVEDTVQGIARHGTVLATYVFNLHQAPFELSITVVCERGTARFEYHRQLWRWMTEPGGEWTSEDTQPLERDTLFTTQANAFLDALGGASPLCPLDEGVATLRTNLAVLRSAESHKWITLAKEPQA